MAAGAYGGITASANYMPKALRDIVALARRSPNKAIEAQPKLTAVSSVVEAPGIPGVKAASVVAGLLGYVMHRFWAPSAEECREVAAR